MATLIRVWCWIDGRKRELAQTFADLEEAREYVIENNAQPGGHVYGIDPEDEEHAEAEVESV